MQKNLEGLVQHIGTALVLRYWEYALLLEGAVLHCTPLGVQA